MPNGYDAIKKLMGLYGDVKPFQSFNTEGAGNSQIPKEPPFGTKEWEDWYKQWGYTKGQGMGKPGGFGGGGMGQFGNSPVTPLKPISNDWSEMWNNFYGQHGW